MFYIHLCTPIYIYIHIHTFIDTCISIWGYLAHLGGSGGRPEVPECPQIQFVRRSFQNFTKSCEYIHFTYILYTCLYIFYTFVYILYIILYMFMHCYTFVYIFHISYIVKSERWTNCYNSAWGKCHYLHFCLDFYNKILHQNIPLLEGPVIH